jgi:hypothetical protein
MNLNSQYIKTFFYKYWWLYYTLSFFLIGLLVYAFYIDSKKNNIEQRISYLSKQLNDCKHRKAVRDSIRVIDNSGKFGCLTFTLIWNNTDDLDIMIIDANKNLICFDKYCKTKDNKFTSAGGQLDIDNNVEGIINNEPVENIYFKCTPPNGIYRSKIHVYEKRNTIPTKYKLIIRKNGLVVKEIYNKLSKKNEWSEEIKFQYNAN